MSQEVPADLRFTKDHEWVRPGADAAVGVSAFAVEQLGDITLVTLDVKVGDAVTTGKAFGTIESVKTLSDLFAPVSGKVVRVNSALVDKPELVNDDCYERAWMVVIETADGAAATSSLLDPKAYAEHVKAAAH